MFNPVLAHYLGAKAEKWVLLLLPLSLNHKAGAFRVAKLQNKVVKPHFPEGRFACRQ